MNTDQMEILNNDLMRIQGGLNTLDNTLYLTNPWRKPLMNFGADMTYRNRGFVQSHLNLIGNTMKSPLNAIGVRAAFMPGFNFTRSLIRPSITPYEVPIGKMGFLGPEFAPPSTLNSIGKLRLPTLGYLGYIPTVAIGGPASLISGGIVKLGGGDFKGAVKGTWKAHKAFFVGGEMATETLLSKMSGIDVKDVTSILGNISGEMTNFSKMRLAEKFKFFKSGGWKAAAESVAKGLDNEAAGKLATLAGNLTTLTMIGTALQVIDPILTSAQIGWMAGSAVGSVVQLGYDTADIVSRQTKALTTSLRSVEFESNLSTMMTQAAITEKNRALAVMRQSQINGSYPYGNETNYM